MILIWSGLGIVVVLNAILSMFAVALGIGVLGLDRQVDQHHVLQLAWMIVCAALTWATNRLFERRRELALEAGKVNAFCTSHTFFFIDLRYWPYLMLAVGVAALFW
jgi:hypothetical protein